MRLILLSYHFPPSPAVGGLRAARVARALADAGHSVHVIAAARPDDVPSRTELVRGLTVETVRAWVNPRFWWVAARRQFGGPPIATASASDRPRAAWKRFVSSLLFLPDDKQGFIPPAVRAAAREIRTGADLLYTTVPPFSTAVAGLIIKRWTGLRWVLEFRDPWTDSHFRSEETKSQASVAANRWLERRCLRYADQVIVASEGIHRFLVPKLGSDQRHKLSVILNGIEPSDPSGPPRTPSAPFRIVYLGALYHRRDPIPFLNAIARFKREGRLPSRGLAVEFVGECHEYDGIRLSELARDLDIAELLSFRAWIPQAEALRLIRQADLLLLLAQDQPDQIPNKLFDYLGAGVPILGYVDPQGETARMLKEVGGHFVVTDDQEETAVTLLTEMVEQDGTPRSTFDQTVLARWAAGRQMAALVALLEQTDQPPQNVRH